MFFHCLVCFSLGVLMVACSPQEGEERYRRLKSDYDQTTSREAESLAEVVVDSARAEDVEQMVKEHQSPDAAIDTDTWLAKQLYAEPGQIMFQRWSVLKKGTSKYEARFTYTYIGGDNRMVKRGWVWNVDTVLKVVSPPRELPPDDRVAGGPRDSAEDTERRIRAAESSLE